MPSVRSAARGIARIGLPAVLKTRRFGYDGKGQAMIREGTISTGLGRLGAESAILEGFVRSSARFR